MSDYTVGNAYLEVTPKMSDGSEDVLKGKMTALGVAAGNLLSNAISSGLSAIGGELSKVFTNFADYEQLVGGVETLFKDANQAVQDSAKEAFRTAGLSANEYMESVTSFSASLVSSLGGDTAKAAEVADKAIIDMSDNANKMGSSMESIQNAYQGFAKQNYTMLDNLKLGYGGTKEEMERLLADASKLAGVEFSIDSYADVIEAIHVIQDSMGIAGTTAEEGAATISGSINMLHGAWENFLTAFGDGGRTMDFSKVTQDLLESLGAVARNAIPAFARIVGSAVTQLPGMLLEAVQAIPSMLAESISAAFGEGGGLQGVLAGVFGEEAAAAFMETVAAIEEPIERIRVAFAGIYDAVTNALGTAFASFSESFGEGVGGPLELFGSLLEGTVVPLLETFAGFLRDQVVPAAVEFAGFVSENVVPVLEQVGAFLADVVLTAFDSVSAFVVESVIPALEGLWAFIQEHVIPAFSDFGAFIMDTVVPDLQELWGWVQENVVPALEGLRDAFMEHVFPALQDVATMIVDNLVPALSDMWDWFKEHILPILEDVANFIFDNVVPALSELFTWVGDNIVPVFETLAGILETVFGWLGDVADAARDAAEDTYDVAMNAQAGGLYSQPGIPSTVRHFAAGGIVSRATLFEAGERGSELIWPSYEPYLSKYGDAIASSIGSAGGVKIEILNPVVRETADVDRILEEADRKLRRASGYSLY